MPTCKLDLHRVASYLASLQHPPVGIHLYKPGRKLSRGGTVITIENLPGRFYLFRKGRFSGAGWRYGQV